MSPSEDSRSVEWLKLLARTEKKFRRGARRFAEERSEKLLGACPPARARRGATRFVGAAGVCPTVSGQSQSLKRD